MAGATAAIKPPITASATSSMLRAAAAGGTPLARIHRTGGPSTVHSTTASAPNGCYIVQGISYNVNYANINSVGGSFRWNTATTSTRECNSLAGYGAGCVCRVGARTPPSCTPLVNVSATARVAADFWASECAFVPAIAEMVRVDMGDVTDYFQPTKGQPPPLN